MDDSPAPPYEEFAGPTFAQLKRTQTMPSGPGRTYSQDSPVTRLQPVGYTSERYAAEPESRSPTGFVSPEYRALEPLTPKNAGFRSNVGNAINSAFGRPSKEIEDVYIAVMGVTGAGKSTFIAQCSKQNVKIGHNLRSCTAEVGDIPFMWNDRIRVHLIDTPGFDDTTRNDTDVLKDIAGWLTSTYQRKILLSGIIYLQRISDPRMGGSQMKNLTMFKELCGKKCFPSVILATTFWGKTDQDLAVEHERQLIETDEFWGYMVKKKSRVVRHHNNTQSALKIVEMIVLRDERIATELQRDMVDKGLGLEETRAGESLNKELIEKEKKHKEQMKQLEADMRKAIEERDEEQIEIISQLQKESDAKIAQGKADIENLQASVLDLQRERDEAFEKLDREMKAQAEKYRVQVEEYNIAREAHAANADAMAADLERTKSELQELMDKHNQKKSGWSRMGEVVEVVVGDLAGWFKENCNLANGLALADSVLLLGQAGLL